MIRIGAFLVRVDQIAMAWQEDTDVKVVLVANPTAITVNHSSVAQATQTVADIERATRQQGTNGM